MGRDPSSIDSLRKYSRTAPDNDDERHGTLSEINGESDRAAAIVMVTHVEEDLTDELRSHLRSDLAPSEEAEIFHGEGLLATFSAKIKMGYALGLFGPETRDDLNILREVRNACAHSKRPISFDLAVVSTVVRRLHILRNARPGDPLEKTLLETSTWRSKFTRAALATSIRLIQSRRRMTGKRDRFPLP